MMMSLLPSALISVPIAMLFWEEADNFAVSVAESVGLMTILDVSLSSGGGIVCC